MTAWTHNRKVLVRLPTRRKGEHELRLAMVAARQRVIGRRTAARSLTVQIERLLELNLANSFPIFCIKVFTFPSNVLELYFVR